MNHQKLQKKEKNRNPYCCRSSQKKSSISAAVDASTEMDLKRLNMSLSEVIEDEMKVWTRSAPADLYYERDMTNPRLVSKQEICR